MNILDKISLKLSLDWLFFSSEKFISAIYKYNNLFIPGPNRVSWKHLKAVVKGVECLKNIVNIANICIVRNKPATEPVMLKVCNVKLSFDTWLVLYMYFILYS